MIEVVLNLKAMFSVTEFLMQMLIYDHAPLSGSKSEKVTEVASATTCIIDSNGPQWKEMKEGREEVESKNEEYTEFLNDLNCNAMKVPNDEILILPLNIKAIDLLCHFRSAIIRGDFLDLNVEEFHKLLMNHVHRIQNEDTKLGYFWGHPNLLLQYGKPIRKLNEGSFGSAYLLEAPNGRKCVMKICSGNFALNLGFASAEYITTSKLSSEFICKTTDILVLEEYGNTNVITIQDYFEGKDMFDTFDTTLLHEIPQMDRVLKMLIRAVHHCHENSVCHNDLKPENIMVSHDGSEIRLIDFGLSILTNGPLTIEKMKQIYIYGTAGYSPGFDLVNDLPVSLIDNLARLGEVKDVFSLGVVFFNVLAKGQMLYWVCSPKDSLYLDHMRLRHKCPREVWIWRYENHYYKQMGNIVKKMLMLDETKRGRIDEILKLDWYSSA